VTRASAGNRRRQPTHRRTTWTRREVARSPQDIAVEGHAGVLVARIDGGPHALFDPEIAKQLKELVDRADRDPDTRAVVFTGTHPDRFLSHSDVRWLQEGGTGFPPINTRIAKLVARMARLINRVPVVRTLGDDPAQDTSAA
jgi:enoyl-CoA hydratase/carnithine racemase